MYFKSKCWSVVMLLLTNVLLSSLLPSSWSFADVPHLIRYQGQAVDSQGVPLEGSLFGAER